ncbi:hypothetical protein [Aromatoleum toluclasticum]|uniref:hypothetical protein n=1 Tax=Aromatoleum toluclasticum TaxID=92003 RepID=UPI0018DED61C|nr:hypothetical protein [Aromatoleum toluclasticum]
MNKIAFHVAIAVITTLMSAQASANLDELLETEVGIMDATEVVCGPVVPDEVRAGIVKFKGKLSPDELLRMGTIRASSSEYKRSFESASKVLQTAVPTSEGGYKLCASQAVKVGNMPRN